MGYSNSSSIIRLGGKVANIISVFRTEKKYYATPSQVLVLKNRLGYVMKRDAHSKSESGYVVRTLYFDSYYDKDYFGKIDGFLFRKKIRLRIYDTETQTAKLELKQKEGDMQRKRSLTLSKEDALKLINCDFSPLLEMNDEFASYLYGIMTNECYRPKCLLTYSRLAFMSPTNQIRVTVDSDIKYSFSNFNLFDDKAILAPIRHTPILEVKYDGFLLQPIKNAIATFNFSECAISKYIIARQDKI